MNSDGSLDNGFNSGAMDGSSFSYVRSMAFQEDGKIIIMGDLAFYGISRNNVARMNNDGDLDMSFNSGTGQMGQFIHRLTLGFFWKNHALIYNKKIEEDILRETP